MASISTLKSFQDSIWSKLNFNIGFRYNDISIYIINAWQNRYFAVISQRIMRCLYLYFISYTIAYKVSTRTGYPNRKHTTAFYPWYSGSTIKITTQLYQAFYVGGGVYGCRYKCRLHVSR